uniref:VQ domain-containing protein n=2 Tax=Physcomitrium patens TaxID=3218 RepID=A0A7I4CF35_PHYPA
MDCPSVGMHGRHSCLDQVTADNLFESHGEYCVECRDSSQCYLRFRELFKWGSFLSIRISGLEKDLAMANWQWDWDFELEGQQESPLSSSPLRSSSSPCSLAIRSEEHVAQEPLSDDGQCRDEMGVDNSPASSRSLVQTLQKCLTSLPQYTNMTDCARQSMSDPAGAAPTTSRNFSSPSKSLGPTKPSPKRRQRPSRRTPVTVLETNPWEFRDTVQRLTGLRAAPNPNAALVRPQPTRPGPSTFVRPDYLQPLRPFRSISTPTPQPNPFITPLSPPMNPLMHPSLLRSRSSELTMPQFPMREPVENITELLYEPEFRNLTRALPVPAAPLQQFRLDAQNSLRNVSNLDDEIMASGSLPPDFPSFRDHASNG